MNFIDVVKTLESKGIMPKSKPGLEKIRSAIVQKPWFMNLDQKKIVTVAGTNGKGTTCACLESLLLSAGQRVGLYTSPHLVQTTERIRVQGEDISEQLFCDLYNENSAIIDSAELSHFESLTLMAADYFFSERYRLKLDYVIFEVGLGGTFDATNIFPNHYAVITALGLDHVDILGNSLQAVAENKFGIVKNGAIVVYQNLALELHELQNRTQLRTKSHWTETKDFGKFPLNLLGQRAVINANTALTVFEKMGFSPQKHINSLKNVRWAGRMQKVHLNKLGLDVFLSGDHNPQGVDSLLEIVRNLNFSNFHFVIGIGKDKNVDQMLEKFFDFPNSHIYLTETPFKGLSISEYPIDFKNRAVLCDKNVANIFKYIKDQKLDQNSCVIVTGSLYLVGGVLRHHGLKT